MTVNTDLIRRRWGLTKHINIDFAMGKMKFQESLRLNTIDLEDDFSSRSYGPLACATLKNNVVAIANEDGSINLVRTCKLKNLNHWIAHDNAIFDLKAFPDQQAVISASGDKTIRKWDIESRKEVLNFVAHHGTIKSVSIYDSNVIATGSRDGSIKIHDLRLPNRTVILIRDAHRNSMSKKPRKIVAKTDPMSCVTNVVFDPLLPRLYSTGANDATIKLWDLRKTCRNSKRLIDGQVVVNQPTESIHHPSRGVHCGYSHLLLSAGKIYAACSDNKIYCYNSFGSTLKPMRFQGYTYDHYLKLAIMGDRYLLVGAKQVGAIIWSLDNRNSRQESCINPIANLGQEDGEHDTNVILADWDNLSVMTFRDDHLVSKWTLQ